MTIKKHLKSLSSAIKDWDYYSEVKANLNVIADYASYLFKQMEQDKEINIEYWKEKINLLETLINNIKNLTYRH